MAAQTRLSEEELSRIVDQYELGAFESAAGIAEGNVQTNILIRTTSGNFVLKYYESRSIDYVRFECELVQFLRQHRFPCPTYLRNRDGDFISVYRGKPFVVSVFESGDKVEQPTWVQRRQLVHAVAQLNLMSKDFKSDYTRHRWNYDPLLCVRLAEDKAKTSSSIHATSKLDWIRLESKRLVLPDGLPKCICHSDFHFSNVLYDGEMLKSVIDWDDANYTYTMFDLVTLIDPFIEAFNWETWEQFGKNDDVFDFAESRRIVQEYGRCRRLSAAETESVFDVFKLGILLDAVWYFDRAGTDSFYEKRKLEYLDGLGRQRFRESLLN